jgi:hypothetical protein
VTDHKDDDKKDDVDIMYPAPFQLPCGGYPYVRIKNGETLHGAVHPMKEGQPAPPGAEILKLESNDGNGFKVTTLLAGSGPAQVANEKYRSGWDNIFGAKTTVGKA